MHKNSYGAKTLIGNWQEERSTEKFAEYNQVMASHLPNPSYNKFVPISKDVGNQKEYTNVSSYLILIDSEVVEGNLSLVNL